MNLTHELTKVQVPNPNKEFLRFNSESVFIDHVLEVLDSNDISHKKNFFLDNQGKIMNSMDNMKALLNTIQDPETNLYKLVAMTIRALERGINRFSNDLKVSMNTEKDNIVLDDVTIQEAINNNDTTKKMLNDLESGNNCNPDEKTIELYDKFLQSRKGPAIKKPSNKIYNKVQYIITSQDLSEIKVVPGVNLTKDVLNSFIEHSGIDNARVFELNEVPTTQKIIQKTVTMIM